MDHSAYIDAAAATLGLKIAAEQRKGVALYFALAAAMAELVEGLPLQPPTNRATSSCRWRRRAPT